MSEIVDALTKLAPEKCFRLRKLSSPYLIYRVLSGIGTHASLNILEAYLMPGTSSGFIRIALQTINGSMIDTARITALHPTASLARAVLGDHGTPTPVANEIDAWLRPDPSGRSGQPGT